MKKTGDVEQLNILDGSFRKEGDNRSLREILQEKIDNIKQKRLELFNKYNSKNYDRRFSGTKTRLIRLYRKLSNDVKEALYGYFRAYNEDKKN